MRQAQLITYGVEDAAAERLQAAVIDQGVALRVTRDAAACLNLLRQHAVGVLLVRVGKNLDAEFTLLAQATRLFPQVSAVVWGDVDHPRLAGLAWDLGARAVFVPLEDPDRLHDAIRRLLPE